MQNYATLSIFGQARVPSHDCINLLLSNPFFLDHNSLLRFLTSKTIKGCCHFPLTHDPGLGVEVRHDVNLDEIRGLQVESTWGFHKLLCPSLSLQLMPVRLINAVNCRGKYMEMLEIPNSPSTALQTFESMIGLHWWVS